MSMREAIRELPQFSPFSSHNEADEAGTIVKPYKRELVSLPEVGAEIFDAADLSDDTGRRILQSWQFSMLKSEDEISSGGYTKVYMDEVLEKSSQQYEIFVQDLYKRNMFDFVDDPVSIVSPFFVVKKNGKLRMDGTGL